MKLTRLAAAFLLASVAGLAAAQTPAERTFTYQGVLKDGASVVQGPVSITWRIYSAASDGTMFANGTANVEAVNGLITFDVPLNAAGLAQFKGDDRWLEVTVQPSGGPAQTLSPRTRLRPAPYALYALNNAFALDTSGNAIFNTGGRVGIGTATPSYFAEIQSPSTLGETLHLRSGNNNFTLMSITNSAAGGANWSILSTGPGWHTGPGDLIFRNVNTGHDRFQLNQDGSSTFNTTNFTLTDSLFSITANTGVFGATSGVNPSNYSRVFSLVGRTGVTNAGTVAVTFNNPTAASQWSAGVGANGGFFFDKAGSGSNIVSVPVLQIRGGSDIAEPYDVAPANGVEAAPGLVVTIDPDRVGKMRIATSAYDHAVAGVISGANGVNVGLTLSQTGTVADGEHPVANVGRVWCYVDADAGGPVKAGDLLTTSATPGHAMKADPARANGAVLGKAMSSLESGKGMVLVLVGLQ
ncbi:MAG: hypothetical protein JNK25_07470 [Phycisphaerae bacterium]|nr:hypothetical protein [Phycisphaerae bacterium]